MTLSEFEFIITINQSEINRDFVGEQCLIARNLTAIYSTPRLQTTNAVTRTTYCFCEQSKGDFVTLIEGSITFLLPR